MGFCGIYPLVMTNVAMENHISWENPLWMAIFHSCVTKYQRGPLFGGIQSILKFSKAQTKGGPPKVVNHIPLVVIRPSYVNGSPICEPWYWKICLHFPHNIYGPVLCHLINHPRRGNPYKPIRIQQNDRGIFFPCFITFNSDPLNIAIPIPIGSTYGILTQMQVDIPYMKPMGLTTSTSPTNRRKFSHFNRGPPQVGLEKLKTSGESGPWRSDFDC